MKNKYFAVLLLSAIIGFSCNNENKKFLRQYENANRIELHKTHNISLDTVRLNDELGNEIVGKEILNNTNKLFFVYSTINCLTCVETVLGHINTKYPKIGEKLIIVSNYNNPRDLAIFKRINHVSGVVYDDYNQTIIAQFNKNRTPVLFYSNNNKIDNVLWVDKGQLGAIDKYLKTIHLIAE